MCFNSPLKKLLFRGHYHPACRNKISSRLDAELFNSAEDCHQAVGTSAMAAHLGVIERRGWPDDSSGSDRCLGLAVCFCWGTLHSFQQIVDCLLLCVTFPEAGERLDVNFEM